MEGSWHLGNIDPVVGRWGVDGDDHKTVLAANEVTIRSDFYENGKQVFRAGDVLKLPQVAALVRGWHTLLFSLAQQIGSRQHTLEGIERERVGLDVPVGRDAESGILVE